MEVGIKLGNDMHKDGVGAVADALIRMPQSGAEQETIRAAIKAFSTVAEVKNVHVSDCQFVTNAPSYEAPTSYPEDGTEEEKRDYLRGKSAEFLSEQEASD